MADPNFIILYVANPNVSTSFYADLLQKPPVESSPAFAMFALDGGVMLGLWARDAVAPASSITGGGGELAFTVQSKDDVNTRHTDWSGCGITIAQAPTTMDFGYTFTALDPDGHRLRVFCPRMA